MVKSKVIKAVLKNQQIERFIKRKYLVISGVVVLLVVAGCHFYGQKNLGGGFPAINATVAVAREENIDNPKDYVALVEAINSVDVVAKVSGSLDKVNFTEGSYVKKDDVLFVIDKERYQANYDLAQALLESAEANLTKTERDYDRQKQLSAKNITSKATFDAAESSYLQAKAAVSQAKAQLELAAIDLKYTEVKAYIDGVIGKTKVTVGNYVNASGEPLAKVVQVNPIRVAFSVTDKEFLQFQASETKDIDNLEIGVELANGEIVKQKLEKAFASNEINTGTATITIYADVENNKGYLKPGAYVKVSVTSSKPRRGIVVPEMAIVQSEGNSFVFTVDENNVVLMQKVTLGETFNGKQVIVSGLKSGDKVMTSGLSNRMLRDGATINIMNAK